MTLIGASPGATFLLVVIVLVGRETKVRGGKAVTVIRGLALDAAGLAKLGKRLRPACGTGGTVKDGVLELQGTIAIA